MNDPFKLITLLLFILLIFLSCGKDEDPEPVIFTISSNTLQFDADGGSQLIVIKSNAARTIEIASS